MSVSYVLHRVAPAFLDAMAAEPELFDLWTGRAVGDLGIDPKHYRAYPRVKELMPSNALGSVTSHDHGVDLEGYLPGIVFLLGRAFEDELDAWDALAGKGSDEFPVIRIGPGYGLAPYVARRIAGLLDLIGTWAALKNYDAEVLLAADVPPFGIWREDFAEAGLAEAKRKLERTYVAAATMGQAVVVE